MSVTDRHKGDIVLCGAKTKPFAWEVGCGSSKHLFSGYINRLCAHSGSCVSSLFATLGSRNGFFPAVSSHPHSVAQAELVTTTETVEQISGSSHG